MSRARAGSDVLLPQQHQRDALAIELAVDAGPVGHDDGRNRRRARLQGRRTAAPRRCDNPNLARKHRWPGVKAYLKQPYS